MKTEGGQLKQYIENQRISKTKIAQDMGITRTTLYQYFDTQTLTPEIKKRFEDYFKQKIFEGLTEEGKKTYREQRLEKKLNGHKDGIPVFETAPQTLTNTPVYRDERVGQADFWITIPDLRDCDYGFRAKGDSMHPLIRNRALVIGREIQDKSIIIFGDIYIVHTTNGLETVKYVQQDESDPEKVVLVPFNEKAKTTTIYKSEILRLFEARAVFNPL